jgi:hypothetical protein
MGADKYYQKERTEYFVELSMPIAGEQLQPLCDWLCREVSEISFKQGYHKDIPATPVRNVSIKINPKLVSGWCFYYHDKAGYIEMSPRTLNLLTVVHEWAHHATRILYEVARNEVLVAYNTHITRETTIALTNFPKYRGHGKAHTEIMGWAVPLAKAWLEACKVQENIFNIPPETPSSYNLRRLACTPETKKVN